MARVIGGCLVILCASALPAFAQNGTVSGIVTRAANATAVPGVSMTMCSESRCYSATTNAIGAYSISVPADTYYLYTQNSVGLIDEIYNNIPCRGYCYSGEVSGITALVVTSGGTLTNRNFALDVGGSITGTIVRAATSGPVAGVRVYAYYMHLEYPASVAYATTNAAGVYSIGGLATGSYYLATDIANGLVNEIYNNVQCLGECDSDMVATSGQAVPVTQGVTTSGINFALDTGGSVSGTVRNSATSAPLANVAVYVVAVLQGRSIVAGNANTNGAGQYTVTGLPTGTYAAYTRNQGSFINEVYNGIQCIEDCQYTVEETPGTPIAVTAGALTPNRNFDLEPGGVITGLVTRTGTSSPIANVRVRAYIRTATGDVRRAGDDDTNASGAYSIPRLVTGSYYLHTDDNYNGSVNEIFADVPCLGRCSDQAIERGTGVAVTAGATTSGRNFALDLGGKLTGTVRSGGGAPINGAHVSVFAKEPSGEITQAGDASTNASGAYTVTGLPTGTYYVAVRAEDYISEIYNEIPCPGYCSDRAVVGAGDAIALSLGGTVTGIDVQLDTGGRISGTVRNAATSAPIAGLYVYAARKDGTGQPNGGNGASTSVTGAYTISGLPGGEYYVMTSSRAGWQDQMYAGVNCVSECWDELVAVGATVTVTAGLVTAGRDFALNPPLSGRVQGLITNAATSAPAPYVGVILYTRVGTRYAYAGNGYSDVNGRYTTGVLPPGNYYAHTVSRGQYIDEIHADIPCVSTCDWEQGGAGPVTLGAPVSVGTGTVTLNFALQPQSASRPFDHVEELAAYIADRTVDFSWYPIYDPFTPIADYVLEIGVAPRTTIVSIPVHGTKYRVTNVPPGRYYARVRAKNGAGLGPASNEYEFTVNPDGSGAPGEPYELQVFHHAGRLEMLWDIPYSGGVVTGYVLEVGSASGLSNIASLNVGSRSHFTYSAPIPPGVYFLRVRARNAASIGKASREVMLVIGGAPAPPDTPSNVGVFVDAARRALIGWVAPRGQVVNYLLEVGSGPGRTDVGVFPISGSLTTLQVPNVPPGTYYIRVRAVNAQGTGLPSYYDAILIVP